MDAKQIQKAIVPVDREPTEDEKWELYNFEENLWRCQAEMLDILENLGEWSVGYQRDYFVLKDMFERDVLPCQRRPNKKFTGHGTDLG